MDVAETSNQHIETTELYITIGDADIVVYICIIIDELFRAIGATVDIGYVDTVEMSNVNIKMGEPDIAIWVIDETSERYIVAWSAYIVYIDDVKWSMACLHRWNRVQ